MSTLEIQALMGFFVAFGAVIVLMPFVLRGKINRMKAENEKIRKGIK